MTDTDDLAARLPRALIYLPDKSNIDAAARCLERLHQQRYYFAGIEDDIHEVWRALFGRSVTVVIVDEYEDLPTNSLPRFEAVATFRRREMPSHRNAPPAASHTHRINRQAEAG